MKLYTVRQVTQKHRRNNKYIYALFRQNGRQCGRNRKLYILANAQFRSFDIYSL